MSFVIDVQSQAELCRAKVLFGIKISKARRIFNLAAQVLAAASEEESSTFRHLRGGQAAAVMCWNRVSSFLGVLWTCVSAACGVRVRCLQVEMRCVFPET